MKLQTSNYRTLTLCVIALCVAALAGSVWASDESPEAPVVEATSKVDISSGSGVLLTPQVLEDASGTVYDQPLGGDFIDFSLVTPEPTSMSCTATAYCQTGTVSCTGCPADAPQHSSCPSGQYGTIGYVTCGNQQVSCAPCTCNPGCRTVCGGTGGSCNNGVCHCW